MGTHFHLKGFFDGCPSDWFDDPSGEKWHTFVFLWTPNQSLFGQMANNIVARLNPGNLQPWGSYGNTGRKRFFHSFLKNWKIESAWLNPVSFRERDVQTNKSSIYEELGFEETTDQQGRKYWTHSYVDFCGHHVIQGLESQILPLLTIALATKCQFEFYREKTKEDGGFDNFEITLFMDHLSGDDQNQQTMLENLKKIVNYDYQSPEDIEPKIKLISRAPQENGDLFADNIAGILDKCLNKENWKNELITSGKLNIDFSWHFLKFINGKYSFVPINLDSSN